jgi:hypothetical protein
MIRKNLTKVVIAVALTLAVTLGSGVVGEQFGVELVPSVQAGKCSTSGGGGGC